MDTGLQPFTDFVCAAQYAQMSSYAIEQLKIRLLDTLGVAIAALDAKPMAELRAQLPPASDGAAATVIGGGRTAADHAARCNTALAGWLDFNDVQLAPAGMCHPSNGIAAVLAAAETADASGTDFLTALAILYATHTGLCDHLSASAGGCAVPEGCGAAAAAAKVMGMEAAGVARVVQLAASALASSGSEDAPEAASAAPDLAAAAVRAALQSASAGTAQPAATPAHTGTAPDLAVVDWSRADLEGVRRTLVRQYAADLHAQAPVDLAVSVSARPLFHPDAVRVVRIKTNQVAFDRLGGGDGSDRFQVRTAAQARRSLPWAVAVGMLDRALGPRQYADAGVVRADVQALLRKVAIIPHAAFTARYPAEMCAQIEVERNDGIVNCTSTSSFRGFSLQPLTYLQASEKFERLAFAFTGELLGQQILLCVRELETRRVRDLTALLARVAPQRL